MHVLSVTINEIATQLATAKPNNTYWRGAAATAFETKVDELMQDLITLSTQLGNQ